MKKLTLIIGMLVLAVPACVFAQADKSERMKMHHETPGAGSVHMDLKNAQSSPAYTVQRKGFFATQVNVDAFGNNILGDAANEPSIAIDPTNPNRMMIGWRQFDNVNSDFRQAGYAYTEDGGQSWTFPGSINAGVFRSDPVLACDPNGSFYYNSLSRNSNDEFLCTVFKTEPGGLDWDAGTFAWGGDKQWMVIDNTTGSGSGNNYSFWTQYWSYCYPAFFTRSSDLGVTYEPCVSIQGYPYWGTLAIGPAGELYIAGAGDFDDIMLVKSINANIPGSDIEWNEYSGVDLGGYTNGWTPVNPQGLLGQVYVDVDISGGTGHGNVYVLASVVRPGLDAADVMIARSTDGGASFDAPVRVNDDPDNTEYQWFGTMSVAPNGRIDVVWLDTRVDIFNGYNSALFYSYSVDEGQTWSTNQQLSEAFDPHVGWPQQEKMGDYFHMISDVDGAHLAWAATLNGEQDVYYAYIEPEGVGINEIEEDDYLSISNYPNPFSEKTTVRYTLSKQEEVKIQLFDVYGKKVMEEHPGVQGAGIHTLLLNTSGLPAGVYFAKLIAGKQVAGTSMLRAGQ